MQCLIKLLLCLEVNSFSNLQLFVQRCSLLERTKAGDRRVAAVEPRLVGRDFFCSQRNLEAPAFGCRASVSILLCFLLPVKWFLGGAEVSAAATGLSCPVCSLNALN